MPLAKSKARDPARVFLTSESCSPPLKNSGPQLHWEEGLLGNLLNIQIFWPTPQSPVQEMCEVWGISDQQDPGELSTGGLRPHLENHCPLPRIVGLQYLRAKQGHHSVRLEEVEISGAGFLIEDDFIIIIIIRE